MTADVVSCCVSINWMSICCLMDRTVIWLDGLDPLNYEQVKDIFNTTNKKKEQIKLERLSAI